MQGSVLQNDLRKVISLVDLLRDIGLDKQLSLPKVVVLGNQSSGKSSLLQQIVGLDFLPRGSGVVTRRPLQLRMNNDPTLKAPFAQFDQIVDGGKKKRFTNFNDVRKAIDQVTDKICGKLKAIVNIPIVLNIYSPHCPNLTVVDLPGITSIPVGDQPQNIYQITRQMALTYINQPRSIILCVIPANQDLSTSEALKIMRQIDPSGQRSIGCLTKIDIMNRGDDARAVLKNQQIPLRYGYVGIKNRCQQDVINNIPVTESLKEQKRFFTTSPIYSTLPPGTFGTEALTHKLTSILYQQIKSSLPDIFNQIKKKKLEAQEQLQKLGPGIASSDAQLAKYGWKSISNFLRIYINSINGIKNTDYDKDPISAELREQLNGLYKDQYDEAATQELQDKDIERAMINFPGDSTIPGFPSIDAFLALLNPLLKKLQLPAYQINNKIHELMQRQATQIIEKVMMKKFPDFNIRFVELVRKVLEKHRKQLQTYLNSLLDAELTYLYTNDTSYLMNDFGLTQKQKKKLESGKIKDPLIFELRKRIDSYYKLVVRNLRDLVPKQIFSFLIVRCIKQLQFEAFQFTSDVNKLKQWLNQPAEVKKKRDQCTKAIKVFEQSQKKIRMDPEISRLVKDTDKLAKIYKKKDMKTPEQLEALRMQKQKKQYQSKAQQAFKKSKAPDNKPDNSGAKNFQPQTKPQVQDPKKANNLFNMFGDNVGDKKKQPQPQKPVVKNDNLGALFGTNTVTNATTQPPVTQKQVSGQIPGGAKSPQVPKKKIDFNFEDAWKAEGSNPVKPQPSQQTKNPIMNNPPTYPVNQPINNLPVNTVKPPTEPPKQPPKQQPKPVEDGKKKMTFNNLFGIK